MLRVEGISKVFRTEGASVTPALQGLSLTVERGEFISIVGPNGCGKSTLLKAIAGDVRPDQGSITLDMEGRALDLLRVTGRQRGHLVARVEQDPRLGTVADLSVWENLWLATSVTGWPSVLGFGSRRKLLGNWKPLLEQLNFSSRLESKVKDLSGGQRQVIAVLFAVLRKPNVLLLDEHTASLDRRNADICLSLARGLARADNRIVLSVTHNLIEALETGDRLIVMGDGKVIHDFSKTEMKQLSPLDLASLIKLQSAHGQLAPEEVEEVT